MTNRWTLLPCTGSLCVSGESFDRQASFRRVASNNDSLSQRYCNLSRRKTITRLPSRPAQTSTEHMGLFFLSSDFIVSILSP